jgi:hypothetical protein
VTIHLDHGGNDPERAAWRALISAVGNRLREDEWT